MNNDNLKKFNIKLKLTLKLKIFNQKLIGLLKNSMPSGYPVEEIY